MGYSSTKYSVTMGIQLQNIQSVWDIPVQNIQSVWDIAVQNIQSVGILQFKTVAPNFQSLYFSANYSSHKGYSITQHSVSIGMLEPIVHLLRMGQ
jgi:hypothetical protein